MTEPAQAEPSGLHIGLDEDNADVELPLLAKRK